MNINYCILVCRGSDGLRSSDKFQQCAIKAGKEKRTKDTSVLTILLFTKYNMQLYIDLVVLVELNTNK